jgi:DNA-binding NarL/FixJ family response regulator
LLADQHALFRESLRTSLDKETGFRVVREARTGSEAVVEAERMCPDLAILDMELPIDDAVRTTVELRERVPGCKILVLGVDADCGKLVELLVAGANGYLIKDVPLSELIHATRAICSGDTLIPPKMLGPLLTELLRRRKRQDRASQRISRLTPREREVLALLAEGADNERIAKVLVISPQTARTHIQNILGKLSVHSRLEAAALVTQNGTYDDLVAADA